jgi:hypothetical protein
LIIELLLPLLDFGLYAQGQDDASQEKTCDPPRQSVVIIGSEIGGSIIGK